MQFSHNIKRQQALLPMQEKTINGGRFKFGIRLG
jgi:hypothetical protein